jgi:ligand-binding sensor domain-containing protein
VFHKQPVCFFYQCGIAMDFKIPKDDVTSADSVHFKYKKSNFEKTQKRFRIFLSVIFAALACGLVLTVLKQKIANPTQKVRFDSAAVVRVGDVSKVYTIKPEPWNKNKLWFGCAEGLHCFDREAVSWKRYGTDVGLPSDVVFDVEFFDGTVWAATSYGPAVLDKERGTFRALLPNDTLEATAIAALNDSTICIYVANKGLLTFSSRHDTISSKLVVPGFKENRMVTRMRSIQGILYIGTEVQDVIAYNPSNKQSQSIKFDVRFHGEAQILDIMMVDTTLYVVTSIDGLWKEVHGDSLVRVKEFPAKGGFIMQPEKDGMWVGTPWGLWRFHQNEDVWVQFVHPAQRNTVDFQVMALFNDTSDMWFGTSEGGAGYFNKKQVKWHRLTAGLSTPNVAAITASDSFVYTASSYRGGYVDCFSAKQMQFEKNLNYNYGIGDPNIQSLYYADSLLLFGGYESFGYINAQSGKRRYFTKDQPLQAYDIAQIVHQGQYYYLATVFGIVRYKAENDSFYVYKNTIHDRATCLHIRNDSLWYGTLGKGIKLLDLQTQKVQWSSLEGINRIVGISGDVSNQHLFVATDRSGLFFMNPSTGQTTELEISKKIIYHDNPTSPENEIRCMAVSDSLLWLGSEQAGCFVYDIKKRKWGNFTCFEGLLNDQVRSFHDSKRYLYIGCYGGLHKVDKYSDKLYQSIFGKYVRG